MSTYLELCQKLALECDISGGDTVPTAVTGQTGELQRVVKWIADAWIEIQERHPNWRWKRTGFTLSTVADDSSYVSTDATDDDTAAAIATFGRWLVDDDEDPGKIFLASAGEGTETWLTYADWNDFKSIYRIGTQISAYPIHVSIDPKNNLVIGPPPNGVYTITGDFQRGIQSFSADGDIPDMPVRFHNLIVYEAMKKYGFFESANEILARANHEAGRTMRQLEADQLPDLLIGEPMA
jgi:hypothetical protein